VSEEGLAWAKDMELLNKTWQQREAELLKENEELKKDNERLREGYDSQYKNRIIPSLMKQNEKLRALCGELVMAIEKVTNRYYKKDFGILVSSEEMQGIEEALEKARKELKT